MIIYNSIVNIQTVKEKDILKEIKKRKEELQRYGLLEADINNIINDDYNIDLCSCNIENMLLNISICELLWYNKIYDEHRKYKGSLQKIFLHDNTERLDIQEETRHCNTFLSAMASIVQKYGKEILDEIS